MDVGVGILATAPVEALDVGAELWTGGARVIDEVVVVEGCALSPGGRFGEFRALGDLADAGLKFMEGTFLIGALLSPFGYTQNLV